MDLYQFASTEGALRAVHQDAPHGFRYGLRLPDVDFAPRVFYIGPLVYISGWPAFSGQRGLLQWRYDIARVVGATIRASLLVAPQISLP